MIGCAMYRCFIKRILDLVLSLAAFPVWLIILMVLAPIIHWQDGGDVFYTAPRLGRGGRVFRMYKFRTMHMNAPDIRNEDGSTSNAPDDLRLTRLGRLIRCTSLDETPQIINVIKGDMSVIGPRPDLPEHLGCYEGDEARKLDVRPGITGYNQAYFRNAVTWKDRIKNDIYYVNHLSFRLDVGIFFKTVTAVLQGKRIYTGGSRDGADE